MMVKHKPCMFKINLKNNNINDNTPFSPELRVLCHDLFFFFSFMHACKGLVGDSLTQHHREKLGFNIVSNTYFNIKKEEN